MSLGVHLRRDCLRRRRRLAPSSSSRWCYSTSDCPMRRTCLSGSDVGPHFSWLWPSPSPVSTGSAPAARRRGGRGSPRGSAVAALLWLAASGLFSFYAANFGTFNATYGSLGAVIIGFMTWLWISAIVILLGAELNAEMEHQTGRDTTTGHPSRARRQRGHDGGHRGAPTLRRPSRARSSQWLPTANTASASRCRTALRW